MFLLFARELCNKIMSGTNISENNGPTTLLAAPVQIAQIAKSQEEKVEEMNSVLLPERDDSSVSHLFV